MFLEDGSAKLQRFSLWNRAELERNRVELLSADSSDESGESALQYAVGSGTGTHQKRVVTIVDPETRIALPDGTVGEIWVKSDSVALGYWNKSELTLKTFRNYLANNGDGPFLRTGDLGFLHEAELFVTGRIKDVIILKGRNYYPQDLELTVETSHPSLKPGSGAVFTAEVDGKERLIVVQEVDRRQLKTLNFDEVIGNIRQAINAEYALSSYAILLAKPGGVPKTSSGKVQRFACRQAYLRGKTESIAEWCVSPRGSAKFLDLQSDIESTMQNLKQICERSA